MTNGTVANQIIDQALETQMIVSDHKQMVSELIKSGELLLNQLTPEKVDLWHAATGVSGEAGELLDAVKKMAVYNKLGDRENIVEELGDLEFYMEAVRKNLKITREETLIHNMNKLQKGDKARYKNGYTDQAAIERADKV